jgi:hypothetical protein
MDGFAGMWTKKGLPMQAQGTLLHLDSAGPHLAPEMFEYYDITK